MADDESTIPPLLRKPSQPELKPLEPDSWWKSVGSEIQSMYADFMSQSATVGRYIGLGTPISQSEFDQKARGYRDIDGGNIRYRPGMTQEELDREMAAYRAAANSEAIDYKGSSDDFVKMGLRFIPHTPVDIGALIFTLGAGEVYTLASRASKVAEMGHTSVSLLGGVEKMDAMQRVLFNVGVDAPANVVAQQAMSEAKGVELTLDDRMRDITKAWLFAGTFSAAGHIVSTKPPLAPTAQELVDIDRAAHNTVVEIKESGADQLTPENIARNNVIIETGGDIEAADEAAKLVANPPPEGIIVPSRPAADASAANIPTKGVVGIVPAGEPVYFRTEAPGVETVSPSSKPQGLYVEGESRELGGDLGGKQTQYVWRAKNSIDVTKEEWGAYFGRYGLYPGNKVPLSAGVKAAKKLLGDVEFDRLTKLKKADFLAEIQVKYPEVDWARYYDNYERIEAVAGIEARKAGYDSIVSGAERVALTDDVLVEHTLTKGAAVDVPVAFSNGDDAAVLQSVSTDEVEKTTALVHIAKKVPGFDPTNADHMAIVADVSAELRKYVDNVRANTPGGAEVNVQPLDAISAVQQRVELYNAAVNYDDMLAARAQYALPTGEPLTIDVQPNRLQLETKVDTGKIGDPIINPDDYPDRYTASQVASQVAQERIEREVLAQTGGKIWTEADVEGAKFKPILVLEEPAPTIEQKLQQATVPGTAIELAPGSDIVPAGAGGVPPTDGLVVDMPTAPQQGPQQQQQVVTFSKKFMDYVNAALGRPTIAMGAAHHVKGGMWAPVLDPEIRASIPGLPSLDAINVSARRYSLSAFLQAAQMTDETQWASAKRFFSPGSNKQYWSDVQRAMSGDKTVDPSAVAFADYWQQWYDHTADVLRKSGIQVGKIVGWTPQDVTDWKVNQDRVGFVSHLMHPTDGLDWARYNMQNATTSQKLAFVNEIRNSIVDPEVVQGASAKLLKERELHFLRPEGQFKFLEKYSATTFKEQLENKIQNLTNLAMTAPYYGPDKVATLGGLVDKAYQQAKRELSFVESQVAALTTHIDMLKRNKAQAADIKAHTDMLADYKRRLKEEVPSAKEADRWYRDTKRVLGVATGEYSGSQGADVSALYNVGAMVKPAWTGMKTSAAYLWSMLGDPVRTFISTSMTMHAGDGNLMDMAVLPYRALDALTDDMSRRWTGLSLNEVKQRYAVSLAIDAQTQMAEFMRTSILGLEDGAMPPVMKGLYKMGDAVFGTLAKAFHGIQPITTINNALRNSHHYQLQYDINDMLKLTGGDFDKLLEYGMRGKAMRIKLLEAGFSKEEWKELFSLRGQGATLKIPLTIRDVAKGDKVELLDPAALDGLNPRIGRLFKVMAHNNLMDGTATAGVYERDLLYRGGRLGILKKEATHEGTLMRGLASTTSLFKGIQYRNASDYLYATTAAGKGQAITPFLTMAGTAFVTAVGIGLARKTFTAEQLERDPAAIFRSPTFHATWLDSFGLFGMGSDMFNHAINRRMNLRQSGVGYGAKEFSGLMSDVIDPFTNTPITGLVADTAGLMDSRYRETMLGLPYGSLPSGDIATAKVIKDLMPGNYWFMNALALGMEHSLADTLSIRAKDEFVDWYDPAAAAILEGPRTARRELAFSGIGYGTMFLAEGAFFKRWGKRLLPDAALDLFKEPE